LTLVSTNTTPYSDHVPDTRFLIIRIGALGDIVQASALVERIRVSVPGAHITWLCGARVEAIVRLFDVDEVIVVDDENLLRGRGWRRVRALLSIFAQLAGRRYDFAALAHFDSRYRVLLWPVLARRKRIWSRATTTRSLPITGRAHSDEYARMLDDDLLTRGPVGGHYALPDVRGRLKPIPEFVGQSPVVLIPGGARNLLSEGSHRRWPVVRYAELARRLIAMGHTVMITGDKGDAWVRPDFENIRVIDRIGRDSVIETLALLASAQAVVSHDTGPLHLARLARAPIVGLFGPTTPSDVLPAQDNVAVIWGGASLACRPCYNGAQYAKCEDHQCMSDISVDAVLGALQQFAPAPS
jgi:heptosyltransferase-2